MSEYEYGRLFDLSGKTVVITGALGLLGGCFSRAAAAYGAQVAVVDLDGERAESFAGELTAAFGGRHAGLACDVADAAAVGRMVRRCEERLGCPDVLLNNAATKGRDPGAFAEPFEDYRPEVWREIMSVNLEGMVLVAQAVGNRMIARGRGGSIVQTSSIYGSLAPDDRIYEGAEYLGRPIGTPAVYAASKAGVTALSRYLAARWAKHGIRVNTLTPGGVFSGQNAAFAAKYGARTPMGRMGLPGELVGAMLYLASDASSYTTGHNLIVDGGLHAW